MSVITRDALRFDRISWNEICALGQEVLDVLAIPYKSNACMVREATVSGTNFRYFAKQ